MKELALIAVIAGCVPVYGLDETAHIPDDADRDLITDPDDNCPSIANRDQLDDDDDGFGDACDGCRGVPNVSQHDEDADLLPDDCDPCPGVEDFHFDDDLDGIGNACDIDPMRGNTRALFEPFVDLGDRWQPGAVAWTLVDGDAVAPTATLGTGDLGLATAYRLEGAQWQLTLGLLGTENLRAGERIGLALRDTDGALVAECMIWCTPTACTIGVAGPRVTTAYAPELIVPTPRMTMEIVAELSNPATGLHNVACVAGEGRSQGYADVTAPAPWMPSLVGLPTFGFAYVDAIR